MVARQQRYTTAAFEQFIALPENADRRFELIAGEIVEKMPTQFHAAIVQLISGYLFVFLLDNPLGWALVETRYQLPGDDANARIPDLSFVREKADYYLANGSQVVWLMYPDQRLVEVLTPDDRQLLTGDDLLDGGALLPGFSVPVSALFPPQA